MIKRTTVEAEISPELQAILDATPPVDEVLADLAKLPPSNFYQDPEFVAGLAQQYVTEDIRRAMAENRINQADLGRRIKKSRAYISQILNDDDPTNFTIETMATIAVALGRRLSIRVHAADEYVSVHSTQKSIPENTWNLKSSVNPTESSPTPVCFDPSPPTNSTKGRGIDLAA